MDWALEDNMDNGLIFCTRLTSRRSGHTHLCKHGRQKDFFLGWGLIVDFSRGSKKDFPEGPKVVKFHFTHPKLRKRPFFAETLLGKCQISITGTTLAPLPHSNAHVCKQERKRLTPLRRRLSQTQHAVLGGPFHEGESWIKVQRLVVLSILSAFHRRCTQRATLLLLSLD